MVSRCLGGIGKEPVTMFQQHFYFYSSFPSTSMFGIDDSVGMKFCLKENRRLG